MPRVPTSKLARSQAKRLRRVLDAAVDLAEKGGFEGVRLRDVAEASDVALGTLYRYFDSKEAILVHAVAEDLSNLEERFRENPAQGESPLERVTEFFGVVAELLSKRPNYVRASVRAVSSAGSEPHTLPQVAAFHLRMTSMVLAALRGEPPRLYSELTKEWAATREGSEERTPERQAAEVLELVWFSLLVGWAGGLCDIERVVQKTGMASELVLCGLRNFEEGAETGG